MRVFVGGSESIDELEESVLVEIIGIIGRDDEVLVGDACGIDSLVQWLLAYIMRHERVKVYSRDEAPRFNEGDWPVTVVAPVARKRREQGLHSGFRLDYAQMAIDADCGIMVWDGESEGTFANMADLLWRGKPVTLFLARGAAVEAAPVRLEALGDLMALAGERKCVPPAVERRCVDECIAYDCMKPAPEAGLGKRPLGTVIRNAPISLGLKRRMFHMLASHENVLRDVLDVLVGAKGSWLGIPDYASWVIDSEVENSFAQQEADISRALDNLALEPEELFTLSEKRLDENSGSDRIDSFVLLSSYDEVEAYLRSHGEHRRDEDITWWYELERWAREDSGRMRVTWTFWLLYDGASGFEPTYFEELEPKWGGCPGVDRDAALLYLACRARRPSSSNPSPR